MPWAVPDFETASMCDLKKAGAWRYAEDVTTEVLVLSVRFQDGEIVKWFPDQPIPERLAAAILDPAIIFIAHNAQFEKAIWRHIMVPQHGWTDIPNERWHDTQATAAMKGLPQDLEFVTKVLGLPTEKDMVGNKLTLGLSKVDKKTGMLPARTPEILARVGEYCDVDVIAQSNLHRRLGWQPPEERRVWLHNQMVNERGVRLDLDLVRQMRKIVDQATPPLADEFRRITGGLNFTQAAKVKAWVNDRGVAIDSLDKEHVAELLGDMDDPEYDPDDWTPEMTGMDPEVHRALTVRRLVGSSSVQKLGRMEASVMADGRVRGTLQYHGTGPGRSAGRLFQPQNFPRGSNEMLSLDIETKVQALMTGDASWVQLTMGAPVESVVGSLRHILIPDRDRVYISGDYSGIQARTVLSMAGQHDKAQLMAEGLDIYIDMAFNIWPSLRFDLRIKELVKEFKRLHTMERQLGKNAVLGLGFQMGAAKFFLRYGKDQALELIETVVKAYRESWAPKVPLLWRALQDASLKAVRNPGLEVTTDYGISYKTVDAWLTARLPSGRLLWYFNPVAARRHMPWSTPEEPDIRWGWSYQARKMGKWLTIYPHGGQLTENAVMGVERDLITAAALKLEANGFPVVLDVHDELLAEPLKADADEKAFQQIMLDSDPWAVAMRIPVQVEGWIGDRYRK